MLKKNKNKQENGLVHVMDDLHAVANGSGGPKIVLGELLDKVGERSHGAMILVPALIALLPTGGIPTVPTIMAALIVLIALQMAFSPDHIWLPRRLRLFSISNSKLQNGVSRVRPYASKLSWLFKARLTFINEKPFLYLVVLALLVMAATMPPLELLPFAAAAPSFVMTLIGLGLTTDDGLWTMAGLSLSVVVLGAFFYLLFTVIL